MESYRKMSALLSSEFDRYLMKHPGRAKKLPKNALIVFQVVGEEGFNSWSERVSLKYRESSQPVFYAKVRGFQTTSAFKDIVLEKALTP